MYFVYYTKSLFKIELCGQKETQYETQCNPLRNTRNIRSCLPTKSDSKQSV